MILKSGRDYQPPAELIEVLRSAYPDIDVDEELRKMEAWCMCNPSNRKTERGVMKFINSWLSRARPKKVDTSTRSRSIEDDLTDTSWAGI